MPLAIVGLVMLMASIQGTIKAIFYKIVPFSNLIHSNGGFRIYFIITTLIIAGWGADRMLASSNNKFFKRLCVAFILIFITTACVSLFNLNSGIVQVMILFLDQNIPVNYA